jgi:hypothetical protein
MEGKLMKKYLWMAVIIGLSVIFWPQGQTQAAAAFKDVQGHWADKDIQTALDRGFVAGYPDGTFKPNGTITRAEAAGMLSRITKLTPAAESRAFADLEGHWSRDQVRKLVALGFIDAKDYPDGFGPDQAVTRFEIMKWIASGLAKSEPDFAQALIDTREALLPTPETYGGGIAKDQIPYIALVRGTGIIVGFPDGTFRPATTTTRAEVVATLLRYEKVEGTEAKGYKALNELREVALTGTNLFSVTDFKYKYVDEYHTDFQGIQGKPITGRTGLATIRIHKMIFIPLDGSVYFDWFMNDTFKEDIERANGKAIYVFEEITFTSNTDQLDPDSYRKEYSGGLVAFREFWSEGKGYISNVKLYNPIALDNEGYIRKNESVRVWFRSGIPSYRSSLLVTDDGTRMYIVTEADE